MRYTVLLAALAAVLHAHPQPHGRKAFEGVVRYVAEYDQPDDDNGGAQAWIDEFGDGVEVHWRAGSFYELYPKGALETVRFAAGSKRWYMVSRRFGEDTVFVFHLDKPGPDQVPLALVDLPGDTVVLGHTCRGMRMVFPHHDVDLWYTRELPVPARAFRGAKAYGQDRFQTRARGMVLLRQYRFTGPTITIRAVAVEPGPVDPALFHHGRRVVLPIELMETR